MTLPAGKGMQIWKLKDLRLSPAEAASMAHDAGLTFVVMKILDGVWPYNQRPVYDDDGDFVSWADDYIQPYIESFQAVGIEVWGYQYLYHFSQYYAQREGLMAVKRCKDLDLQGLEIDAEGETKYKTTEATAYTNELESMPDDIEISLASYRYPSLHLEVPWDTYLRVCSCVMPQVYWELSSNPGAQLIRSFNEYQGMTDLPYMPIGAAYGRGTWHATQEQVLQFMQTAEDLNLPAVSFWRWQTAVDLNLWNTIAEYDYGGITPPPPQTLPVDDYVIEVVHPHMVDDHGYVGPPPAKEE